MSDENKPDQTSESGGVTINAKGNVSAANIIGRDYITNVFHSDRLIPRTLVVVGGVIILMLVALAVAVLRPPI